MARLKSDYGVDVNEELQIALLLEMMPQTITDAMVQRIKADAKYIDVKQSLLEYVENREDFDGVRPMDTNHIEGGEQEQESWEEDEDLG